MSRKDGPRRVRSLIAGTAVALPAIFLAGCVTPPPEVESRSIVIAIDGLQFLEPPVNSVLFPNLQATYESLVRWGWSSQEWQPYLAESVSQSEDRKTLGVKLREGVRFSDGTVLDAEAAKAVLDAQYSDEAYWWYPTIQASGLEIVVTGEYQLEFRADVPITTALPLDTSGLVSPTVYLDPDERATLPDNPVGTGRYLLEEVAPDVSARYVRNHDYWNPEAVDFDEVTYQVFSDPVASLNALKSAQIDAAILPEQYIAEAEASGLSVFAAPPDTSNMLVIFDTAGEIIPALGDVRVRRAMSMAFDRAAIVENTQYGLGGASAQVFPENHPGHVDGVDDRYSFDVEGARDLMAEAGYADGFDLVIPRVPDSESGNQYRSALEPIIVQALSEIGVRVTFETVDTASWGAKEPQYPVQYRTQNTNAIYIYSSDQGTHNWSSLFDDEARDLLEVVRSGTIDESNDAWAAFGAHVLDEAWFIPVTQLSMTIWVTQPDIELDMSESNGFAQIDWFHLAD